MTDEGAVSSKPLLDGRIYLFLTIFFYFLLHMIGQSFIFIIISRSKGQIGDIFAEKYIRPNIHLFRSLCRVLFMPS